MPKTIEENFRDWEADLFGFGYGSGEEHTVPAVKRFLELCPDEGAYDYRDLERELTPTVAWLLINSLAHANILEYGTSPRHAWLTPQGKALQALVTGKSAEDLIALTAEAGTDYIHCMRNTCNCRPAGYGVKCINQFWR